MKSSICIRKLFKNLQKKKSSSPLHHISHRHPRDKSGGSEARVRPLFTARAKWRWGPPWGDHAKPFLDVCFDGDLMQRCAGVPGSGRLSRGSKGCVPQWGRIEGREEARCILMGPIIRPPWRRRCASHNETRIILILPHLVTENRSHRVDYNDLFAPAGAGLTGLPNRRFSEKSAESRFTSGNDDFGVDRRVIGHSTRTMLS